MNQTISPPSTFLLEDFVDDEQYEEAIRLSLEESIRESQPSPPPSSLSTFVVDSDVDIESKDAVVLPSVVRKKKKTTVKTKAPKLVDQSSSSNYQEVESIIDEPVSSTSCSEYSFQGYGEHPHYKLFTPLNQSGIFMEHSDNQYDQTVQTLAEKGSICPSGFYMETPRKIRLELKPHQKRTLYEMIAREDCEVRLNNPNLFVLADNVGSGKSLSILSLLAERPTVQRLPRNVMFRPRMDTHSPNPYTSGIEYDNRCVFVPTNIIVVPHGIYYQWKEYIEKHTRLPFVCISGNKDIEQFVGERTSDSNLRYTRGSELLEKLQHTNILLVKSTFYSKLMDAIHEMVNTHQLNISANSFSNVLNQDLEEELSPNHPDRIISTLKREYHTLINKFSRGQFNSFDIYLEKIAQYRETIDLGQCDSFLSTEPCKTIHKYKKSLVFERIIIDEADSIQIAGFLMPVAKVSWLITSSVYNIAYPNGKDCMVYSSHGGTNIISTGIRMTQIRHLIHQITSYISEPTMKYHRFRLFSSIVKNHDAFIQDSVTLPSALTHYINCYTPPSINAVANVVSNEVLTALNAGDIGRALEMLGVNAGTQDDIVSAVTMDLQTKKRNHEVHIAEKETYILTRRDEIDTLEREIQKYSDPGYINPSEPDSNLSELSPVELAEYNKSRCESLKATIHTYRGMISSAKQSIKQHQEQLASILAKINDVRDRMTITEDATCAICADIYTNPSVTPCCNNVFCLGCIHTALTHNHKNTCPMCRTVIKISDVRLLKTTTTDSSKEAKQEDTTDPTDKLPTKLEMLIRLIQSAPTKRFLVFSEYDGSFHDVQKELVNYQIRYSKISGNANHIRNLVSQYKNNQVQVLLLNARNFGAGLNLECTDDIIVFHRMGVDLERQIIGRAQRLGRTHPLTIHYLCLENEYAQTL